MPISYIYTGQPMVGTTQDDFIIAYAGSTGTSANTVNGNAGDDWVMGDSTDTWIPNQSYSNGTIATAFNLETLTSTWTTSENPLFGDSSIPHSTAIVETTIGQSEMFRVAVGAGQQIIVDIDFASNTALGSPRDLVVELMDSLGNVIATADDSFLTDGGLGSAPSSPGAAGSYDPYLSFTVATGGIYYINIRPFGGGPGSTFTENNTFIMNVSVGGHAVGTNPVMGNDALNGGDGDDNLFGQGGDDVINGGIGADLIHAGSGMDIVHGDDGNDVLYGGDGTEENIHGDGGNDTLYSGGEGHYYGDAGNDLIYAGLTAGVNEILDGGADVDTIDTTTWNGTYVIDLVTGVTNFGESFINFENVISGNGADTVTGTSGDNIIRTNGGVDILNGGDGNDTLIGGLGDDTLNGGAGSDTIDYSAANLGGVTVNLPTGSTSDGQGGTDSFSSIENVTGTIFADILTGDAQANSLFGNAGNDQLTGNDGDDILRGGAGVDVLNGGAGVDTADYALAGSGVTAQLNTNASSNDGNGGTDTFSSIENLTGSNFNDTLIGSATTNVLRGGLGADTLIGLGGNDVLWGGAGALNTLQGGLGDDYYMLEAADSIVELAGEGTDTVNTRVNVYTLANNVEILLFTGPGNFTGTGNALANTITGSVGDDNLRGRGGVDVLNGGDGIDTVDYTLAAAGVTARLDSMKATNDGDGATDNFSSVENLTGSNYNDLLIGNGGNNVLMGGIGTDTLLGFNGDDILWGGSGGGNNQLQGGQGNDWYVLEAFDTVVELVGEGIDTVEARIGSYTMGSNIENLLYTGPGGFTGSGNALNNTITGGEQNDILKGGGGNDTINGNLGSDELQLRGTKAQYTVAVEGAGYRVIDTVAGRDGSTFITSIEKLRFLTGNTTTALIYPPMLPAPPEPDGKHADPLTSPIGDDFVAASGGGDPLVLPGDHHKAFQDGPQVLPGVDHAGLSFREMFALDHDPLVARGPGGLTLHLGEGLDIGAATDLWNWA